MTMTLQDMIWSKEKNKWCTHTVYIENGKDDGHLPETEPTALAPCSFVIVIVIVNARIRYHIINLRKEPKCRQMAPVYMKFCEPIKQKQNLRAVALSSGAARTACRRSVVSLGGETEESMAVEENFSSIICSAVQVQPPSSVDREKGFGSRSGM